MAKKTADTADIIVNEKDLVVCSVHGDSTEVSYVTTEPNGKGTIIYSRWSCVEPGCLASRSSVTLFHGRRP